MRFQSHLALLLGFVPAAWAMCSAHMPGAYCANNGEMYARDTCAAYNDSFDAVCPACDEDYDGAYCASNGLWYPEQECCTYQDHFTGECPTCRCTSHPDNAYCSSDGALYSMGECCEYKDTFNGVCPNVCAPTGVARGVGFSNWEALYADDLSAYPGYTGDLEVTGSALLAFDGDAVTIKYSISGVEAACTAPAEGVPNSCGIHIHSGTSCETAGGHYYADTMSSDPWDVSYTTDAASLTATGTLTVMNGHGFAETAGRVVVVHGEGGERVACAPVLPVDPEAYMDADSGVRILPLHVAADAWEQGTFDFVLDVRGRAGVQPENEGARYLVGFDEAHIPGAFSVPGMAPNAAKVFDVPTACKSAKILVNCWTGVASLMSATHLVEAGFTNVYTLKDAGIWQWIDAGLTVVENVAWNPTQEYPCL